MFERDRLPGKTLRQRDGLFGIAITNQQSSRLQRREPLQDECRHLSCTDREERLIAKLLEYVPGVINRDACHAQAAFIKSRFVHHLLADCDRPLKERIEHRSGAF